jgi:hypothetical protein
VVPVHEFACVASAARVAVGVVAAVLAGVSGPLLATQQTSPPTLDGILRQAATYLESFASDASGVVLEETYTQQTRAKQLTTRRLRSDLLITADRAIGWYEFRDVFEVDGKPVRDRDDRLARLFAEPSPSALVQARRIVAEGARFNLNPEGLTGNRTLNLPTAALFFLRGVNQRRSSFNRNGFTSIGDRRVAIVEFKETAKPRLIGTVDQAAAKGTFWIEPETGAVLRTELKLDSGTGTMTLTMSAKVEYALDARTQIWLPRTMDEHYEITSADGSDGGDAGGVRTATGRFLAPDLAGANVSLDGSATYSNVRKFNVAVDEKPAN